MSVGFPPFSEKKQGLNLFRSIRMYFFKNIWFSRVKLVFSLGCFVRLNYVSSSQWPPQHIYKSCCCQSKRKSSHRTKQDSFSSPFRPRFS